MYFFTCLFIEKLYLYFYVLFNLHHIYLYFIRHFQDIKTYITYINMPYIVNNIDYDYISEDNDEIIYENIIRTNPTYDNDIIENNTYYIGLCSIDENKFIINGIIPFNIFMIYNYDQLLDYLLSYSIMENNWQNIEIIKVQYSIDNSFITYNCIVKTHFIRLLQKKWKYYLQRRNKYLVSSKFFYDLRDREIGIIKKISF